MKNQLEAILKNAEADLEKAQNINDILLIVDNHYCLFHYSSENLTPNISVP